MSISEARWPKTGLPNKFPHAFYILLCFFWFSGVFSGQAQTNSYISSGDGFWDEARLWSLAAAPSVSQSGITITNAVSKTVTIDSTTSTLFPQTLTISNLLIAAPSSGTDTNTLYLDNTGTIAVHILDGLTVGISLDSYGYPVPGGGELISTNSTLIVDGLLGGQLGVDGTMVIMGGSLITTNCTLVVGTSDYDYAVGNLTVSNGGIVLAQGVAVGNGYGGQSTIQIIGATMILSSSLAVGNGAQTSGDTLLITSGGLLVVTNGSTELGNGSYALANIIVSNSTMLARDMSLGTGYRCSGGLTIEDGTVTVLGSLDLGAESLGSVSLNGGALAVTNGETLVGELFGDGALTIENGLFLAQEIDVALDYRSNGNLTVSGGSAQLSSDLQVGGGGQSSAGVLVNGGELVVTNGMISVSEMPPVAQIEISSGQLAAKTIELGRLGQSPSGGMLMVDGGSVTVSDSIKLGDCVSNTVGQITLTGGQLIVTNATHTAFIDLQNGQLVLSNGVLRVDNLVMTNSCSQFIHTGGTLIVGSFILDPNAFGITSVAREGNNLRVSWLMAPGASNALQVTKGDAKGSYSTNGFTDIFIVTNNTTTGSLTNYLDLGGATNKPSRYYRARLAP